MHKVLFIATSALTLMTASAAFADADLILAGAAGPAWLTGDDSSSNSDAAGYALKGAASLEYDFTPVIGAQADVVLDYNHIQFDDVPYQFDRQSLDGALHLFYRDEGSFLLGGFAQLGTTTLSSNILSGIPDTGRGYVGVEGQVYIDNLTLYGQVGLAQYDFGSPGMDSISGAFGTIEARYFLTPNFKVAATAGLLNLDFSDTPGIDDMTTLKLGASAEYKLDDMPVSVFASIDYSGLSFGGASMSDYHETRVMVGLKFAMGEETLFDHDRSGVTLKPVEFGGYGIGFFSEEP